MTAPDQLSVSLELAAGDGRIARRSDALLFVAAGGEVALVDAFIAADSAEAAVDSVCTAVLQAGSERFGTSPFAMVHWSDRTRLLVSGPLTLHTNQSSAPTLSGAGSTTWIEHTLLQTNSEVRIGLDGPATDPTTDLRDGVVPASGFALCVGVTPTEQVGPDATVTDIFTAATAAAVPTIVFGTGDSLAVDRGFLIGRNPDPSRAESLLNLEPYRIDDTKLSRNHLVIDRSGHDVVIIDCGSLNGSVLISEPGAAPLHLDEARPVTLGPESVLYLGDQVIRLGP